MQESEYKEEMRSLLDRYKTEIEKELGSYEEAAPKKITTREYQQFKSEFMPPHYSYYEKLCNLSEKILKLKPEL